MEPYAKLAKHDITQAHDISKKIQGFGNDY